MEKNMKRLFSVLLVLAMCLSFIPASVFAASETVTTASGLTGALASATSGDVITLGANIEIDLTGQPDNGVALVVPSGVTLDGGGNSITVIGGTANCTVVGATSGTDVKIRDLTIVGGEFAKHGVLAFSDGGTPKTSLILEDVKVSGCKGYGVVVNNAIVTASGLEVSGNGWGGVNVDSKDGNAQFTMSSGDVNTVVIESAAGGTTETEITGGKVGYVVTHPAEGESAGTDEITISGTAEVGAVSLKDETDNANIEKAELVDEISGPVAQFKVDGETPIGTGTRYAVTVNVDGAEKAVYYYYVDTEMVPVNVNPADVVAAGKAYAGHTVKNAANTEIDSTYNDGVIAFHLGSEDVTVSITTKDAATPTYVITTSTEFHDHVTLAVDRTTAAAGEKIAVVANAADGYTVENVCVYYNTKIDGSGDLLPVAVSPLPTNDGKNNGYYFVMPAGPVAVFVGEEANTYTVEFTVDGALYALENVKTGDPITAPAAPEKAGYNFQGWFNGETKLTGSEVCTGDVTYTAEFEPAEYSITYADATATGTTCKYGETFTTAAELDDTVEEKFLGWTGSDGKFYLAGEEYTFYGTENLVLTALYQKDTQYWVVKFLDVDGSLYDVKLVEKKDAGVNITMPPYTPNTSWSWYVESEGATGTRYPQGNNTYTVTDDVTFVLDDQPVVSDVFFEVEDTKGNDLTSQYASLTTVKGTENELINVTFDVLTGYRLSSVTAVTASGKALTCAQSVANDPTYTYNFTMPAEAVTVTIRLEQLPVVPVMYTITLLNEDGGLFQTFEVEEGKLIGVPEAKPAKEGSTFAGWYTEDGVSQLTDATTATANVTYIAKFTPVSGLTVTYAGDDASDSNTYTYGTTFKTQKPDDAHGFIAWQSSDGRYMAPGQEYVITENLTLTAIRETEHPIYVVQFKDLDGDVYQTLLATYENKYTVKVPAVPTTIEGYTNLAWDLSGITVTGATAENGNITQIGADLTIPLDGTRDSKDVIIQENKIDVNDKVNALTPQKHTEQFGNIVSVTINTPTGYYFDSITAVSDGKAVAISAVEVGKTYTFVMPAEDVTVTINYKEIPAESALVKFIYTSDGEVFSSMVVKKNSNASAPAAAPVMDGWDFQGWKLADGTGSVIAAGNVFHVPANAGDEVTYVAQWTPASYTVNYLTKVSGYTIPAETKGYGDVIELPNPSAENPNYTFVGWKDQNTSIVYTDGANYTVTASTTLEAVWSTNKYVVRFVDTDGRLFGYEYADYGDKVAAPSQNPTKEGYVFQKWTATDSEGNPVDLIKDQPYTVTGDVTFVAQWETATYTVSTSASNATIAPVAGSVDFRQGNVSYGEFVSFTVTPNATYSVNRVYITYMVGASTVTSVLTADADDVYHFNMPAADVTIHADTEKTEFTVYTQSGMPAIGCNVTKANVGEDVAFTVTASEGASIKAVYVQTATGLVPVQMKISKGVPVYHFTMPAADVTIYAQEATDSYSVYYTDVNNQLLDIQTVAHNANAPWNFAKAPEIAGYTFAGWVNLLTGVTYPAEANMPAVKGDLYLKAVYNAESFEVRGGKTDNLNDLRASFYGSTTPEGDSLLNGYVVEAPTGSQVTITAVAEYDYSITGISVHNVDGTKTFQTELLNRTTKKDSNGNDCEMVTYTFTMPAEAVVVDIYTAAKSFQVNVVEDPAEGGTYRINGFDTSNLMVAQDGTVTIDVTPEAGYEVVDIVATYKLNSVADTKIVPTEQTENSITFDMVSKDVTVTITYSKIDYVINVEKSNAVTFNPGVAGTVNELDKAVELLDLENQGYVRIGAVKHVVDSFIAADDSEYPHANPQNSKAKIGDEVSLFVKAARGYELDKVVVTYNKGKESVKLTQDKQNPERYYFQMPAANVEVTATFVKQTYTITKTADSDVHGTVTMGKADAPSLVEDGYINAQYKDGIVVNVVPDDGYYVKSIYYWLMPDTAEEEEPAATNFNEGWDDSYYEGEQLTDCLDEEHSIFFNVPSTDVVVEVTYEKIDYTIKPVSNEGGELKVQTKANAGDQITVTTTPEHGYKLVSLSVVDAAGKQVDKFLDSTEPEKNGTTQPGDTPASTSYYFEMPASAVTVTAEFEKVDFVVTYLDHSNRVIGSEGVTFEATADVSGFVSNVVEGPEGQHFIGWTSDDVENPVTTPSVTNDNFVVVKDTKIYANFANDAIDVIYEPTVNGTVTDCDVTDTYYGDIESFTVTPDTGYEIDTISVYTEKDKSGDYKDIHWVLNDDDTYSFRIPATYKASVHKDEAEPVHVKVTFKKIVYTLTKDAACETNGTIEVNGKVTTQTTFSYEFNTPVTILATPDAGYYVKEIKAVDKSGNVYKSVTGTKPAIDGVGTPLELAFNMPAYDLSFTVDYEKIDYSVSTTVVDLDGEADSKLGEPGTVTVSKNPAQINDVVTVTVAPATGYALESLTVTYDGESSCVLTGVGTNKFTFTMPAKAVKVTASFAESKFIASLIQKGEGETRLNQYYSDSMGADYHDVVTITAKPASGWKLTGIVVDGGKVTVNEAIQAEGGDYTFVMPSHNVKVEVTYEKIDYSITKVFDAKQGTVTTDYATSAQVGDVVTITVKPVTGYVLDSLAVTYDGGKKSCVLTGVGANKFTFTMPAADVTVTALFTEENYSVALTQKGEGESWMNGYYTVSMNSDYLDTVTVTAKPAEGWKLTGIVVDGGKVTVNETIKAEGGDYTFTMPERDVKVVVTFEKIEYTLTAHSINFYEEGHGKVTVSASSANIGDKIDIVGDPDDGYRVKKVIVVDAKGNSVPVSFVSETAENTEKWSFTMPAEDVEITVKFEVKSSSYYTDVRTDSWYYNAVTFVTDRGYFQGVSETLFAPYMNMTREMFVTVIARIDGIDVSAYASKTSKFQDVKSGSWYAPYIVWAEETGVVNGMSATEFGVGLNITREQMFTMLYRYAAYCGMDMTVENTMFLDRYTDRSKISDYAVEALNWCVGKGIARGMSDTTINPKDLANRAQAAQMFMNYCDKVLFQ